MNQVKSKYQYLNHPAISARYFFPRAKSASQSFQIQSQSETLECLRYVIDPSKPTLLHFHGNGEIVADYEGEIANAFLNCGVNVVFAEYRGYGGSSGTPLLGEMLEDTEAIIKATQVPPEEIFVFGRSVGSIYAIETARRYPNIAGLILESGIAAPLQRLLLRVTPEELGTTIDDLEQEVEQYLNHKEVLNHHARPTLILHARNDNLVTLEHAQHNYDWTQAASKKLHIFERGDHNSIMFENWTEYFALLADFIKEA